MHRGHYLCFSKKTEQPSSSCPFRQAGMAPLSKRASSALSCILLDSPKKREGNFDLSCCHLQVVEKNNPKGLVRGRGQIPSPSAEHVGPGWSKHGADGRGCECVWCLLAHMCIVCLFAHVLSVAFCRERKAVGRHSSLVALSPKLGEASWTAF